MLFRSKNFVQLHKSDLNPPFFLVTDSRQAQTSTQPYVRSRSKWNVMAISNFYEWYLVSIQSISHLLKSSFHSHFGIHRYFVLLVRPPNVICFEKKTSGDSRFQ